MTHFSETNQMDAEITSQAVELAGNTDFSILSLFLRADFIVNQ